VFPAAQLRQNPILLDFPVETLQQAVKIFILTSDDFSQ
jgi:hypothetical protein